jgi:hypothetical protein
MPKHYSMKAGRATDETDYFRFVDHSSRINGFAADRNFPGPVSRDPGEAISKESPK